MNDFVPVRRALVSVSDKTGLAELGRALAKRGIELLSTGGSANALRNEGLEVVDVSDITGFPEMMGGRVKTLHPRIHGGLLALRDDANHRLAMTEHDIPQIDLLVVNLYPFPETVAKNADYAECVENIDRGGTAMIRAAAKNHAFVNVVVDVGDYQALLEELDAHENHTGSRFRKKMALAAFSHTAAYDAAVSEWMSETARETAPNRRVFTGRLAETLRYGENPHQAAAFYVDGTTRPGVATAIQIQGKKLSYNNISDTDAAFELVSEFNPADGPVCAIVKHANPCGVARGDTPREAYLHAFDCDRVSAFGGIVALNRPVDGATAKAIAGIFTEVVIAPGIEDDARTVFSNSKNTRVLITDGLADPKRQAPDIRHVSGGYLVQERDGGRIDPRRLRTVTRRAPSDAEMSDMLFAWTVAKHVKSNAIVYARNGATAGIGAGQTSRVDSCRIAASKARDMARELRLEKPATIGSVVASDAFFPFADGLMTAVEAGATAVIQPGGSIRDEEVVAVANEAGIAMVFTGIRHFRH